MLVAAVCETVLALAEGLAGIKFDFSCVTATDFPKIVFALKELDELMSRMGITDKNDISTAVRFGERLDQHPENKADSTSYPYPETRREFWAESEPYELAKSSQIETGTGRNAQNVDGRVYPSNYEIPDMCVKELWEILCRNGDGKLPSIKQMRRDLDNSELFDEVYGEDAFSFEDLIEVHRLLLSDDWRSHTPRSRKWHEDIERECMAERREKINKLLAGETEGIDDPDLERLAQLINRSKNELGVQTPSVVQNKNGDSPHNDSQDRPALPNAVETAQDLTLPDKPPTNGHAGAHQQP